MKKTVTALVSAVVLVVISGCAIQPQGLSDMPVIKEGMTTDIKHQDYVKLIPEGSKIPFYINVEGDAFKSATKEKILLTLNHELYVYGDTNTSETIWVSHNKKDWNTIDEVFEGQISLTIDSNISESSLNLSLEVNRKFENRK